MNICVCFNSCPIQKHTVASILKLFCQTQLSFRYHRNWFRWILQIFRSCDRPQLLATLQVGQNVFPSKFITHPHHIKSPNIALQYISPLNVRTGHSCKVQNPSKDHSQFVSFQFKCNVHIKYLVFSSVEYFGVKYRQSHF